MKFFITLLDNENYSEIGKLAFLLYSLAPDSGGFSLMNITKNYSRSRLRINAIMAIASDNRKWTHFLLIRC